MERRACSLVRECLDASGLRPEEVSAVSTTSQRGGFVLLDPSGAELYAGPNADTRAFFEGMEIDERLGERVYGLTGRLPSFLFAPARLEWFRRNDPDTARRISTILPLNDWLSFKLTGDPSAERSAVTELGLLPVSDSEPEDSVLRLLDIDPGLMPRLQQLRGADG